MAAQETIRWRYAWNSGLSISLTFLTGFVNIIYLLITIIIKNIMNNLTHLSNLTQSAHIYAIYIYSFSLNRNFIRLILKILISNFRFIFLVV